MSIPKSDQVYTTLAHNVYRNVNDRIGTFRGYSYNKDLSTDETGVWYNASKNEVIVSYRGSTTSEDWLKTDLSIAKGTFSESSRASRNKKVDDNIRSRFPQAKYVYAGHSLGGTSALYQAHLTNSRAVVVNPGLSLKKEPWTKSPQNSQDTVIYRTSRDVVSASAAFTSYKTVTVEAKSNRKGVVTRIAEDVSALSGPLAAAVFQVAQEQNIMHSSENFTFYDEDEFEEPLVEQVLDKFQQSWRAVFLTSMTYASLLKVFDSKSRVATLLRHYVNKQMGDGRGSYQPVEVEEEVLLPEAQFPEAKLITPEDLEVVERVMQNSLSITRAFEAEANAVAEAGEGAAQLSEGAAIFSEGAEASELGVAVGLDALISGLDGGVVGAAANAVVAQTGLSQKMGRLLSKIVDRGVRAITNSNTAKVSYYQDETGEWIPEEIRPTIPADADEPVLLLDSEPEDDPVLELDSEPEEGEEMEEAEEEEFEGAEEVEGAEEAGEIGEAGDVDLLTDTFKPNKPTVFDSADEVLDLDELMKEVDMRQMMQNESAFDFDAEDFQDLVDVDELAKVGEGVEGVSGAVEGTVEAIGTVTKAATASSRALEVLETVGAGLSAISGPLIVITETFQLAMEINRIQGTEAEDERLSIAMKGKNATRDFDDTRYFTGIAKNRQKMAEDFNQNNELHEYFWPRVGEAIQEFGTQVGDVIHVVAPIHFVEKLLETVRDQEEGLPLNEMLKIISSNKDAYDNVMTKLMKGTLVDKAKAESHLKAHLKSYTEKYYTAMVDRIKKEETDVETMFEERVLKGDALIYDHHIISYSDLNSSMWLAKLDETITFLPPKGSKFYPFKKDYFKAYDFFFNTIKPRIDAGHYSYIYSILRFHQVWKFENDYFMAQRGPEQMRALEYWLYHFVKLEHYTAGDDLEKHRQAREQLERAKKELDPDSDLSTRKKAFSILNGYGRLATSTEAEAFYEVSDLGILLAGNLKDNKFEQSLTLFSYIADASKNKKGEHSNVFWFAREVWRMVSAYLKVGPFMLPSGYPTNCVDDMNNFPYHPSLEREYFSIKRKVPLSVFMSTFLLGDIIQGWKVKREPEAQALLSTMYEKAGTYFSPLDRANDQEKIESFVDKLPIYEHLYSVTLLLLAKKLGTNVSDPALVPLAKKIMKLQGPALKNLLMKLKTNVTHSSHDDDPPSTEKAPGTNLPVSTKSPKAPILDTQTTNVDGKHSNTLVNDRQIKSGPGKGKTTTKSTEPVQKKYQTIYRNNSRILEVRPTKFQRTESSRLGVGGNVGRRPQLNYKLGSIDKGYGQNSFWGRL